jgi:hypothetical protein
MRSGVSTAAADIKPALVNAFVSLGCNVASAKYLWRGSLCRGSTSNINFTEVAAVDSRSNAPLRTSRGALCRLVRGTNAPVNGQRFGNCGVAPALAGSLPVRVCGATGVNPGGMGVGTTPAGTTLPKVPLQPLEQVSGWQPAELYTLCTSAAVNVLCMPGMSYEQLQPHQGCAFPRLQPQCWLNITCLKPAQLSQGSLSGSLGCRYPLVLG